MGIKFCGVEVSSPVWGSWYVRFGMAFAVRSRYGPSCENYARFFGDRLFGADVLTGSAGRGN